MKRGKVKERTKKRCEEKNGKNREMGREWV